MPEPTRPPECGMIRRPDLRMAATTATFVPGDVGRTKEQARCERNTRDVGVGVGVWVWV